MSIDPSAYKRVRESAGLFDASHLHGRLYARGKDALDLLNRLSTGDLTPLFGQNGLAIRTVLTNEKGRIVDVLQVIKDESGHVVLITSKDKEQTVMDWLDKFTIMEDARFLLATEEIAQYVLYGPRSQSIVELYAGRDLSEMPVEAVAGITILGTSATLFQAQPIGGRSWGILAHREHAEAIKRQLTSDILTEGGVVVDDELFEVLRIESGIPIAPNELNEKHNPLEIAQTASAVSFTKGCYIGQEVIARLDAQSKVQRQLVGLHFENGMPAVGDRISDEALVGTPLGDEIGEVTSLAHSPANGAIGLGYVRARHANPGPPRRVSIKDNRGNTLPATLVTLPF